MTAPQPLPLEAAWDRLLALASPLSAETLPVEEAVGRHLAQELIAQRTQPEADLSAMDGFAVAGCGPWSITGEARAGAAFAGRLANGVAVRISTGAACPPGTTGIVPVEDAVLAGNTLSAPEPVGGRFIRRRGFDFHAGDPLLCAGSRIGPAQVALARAAGHQVVATVRQPRLTVIEAGDELVANPADCPPGRLPASNGAMVAALAQGDCAAIQRLGPVPDTRAALVAALSGAATADVIVTTAGASVGEHDHARAALEEWGAQLAFWRVAVRPGKPLLVARRGTQLILGLPGNPVSSFVTAILFLRPLLRALGGARSPLPPALSLRLSGDLPAGGDRREFLRARLINGDAAPLPERDSSALRSLAAADLLIDRPARATAARAGDRAQCYWIGNGGMA